MENQKLTLVDRIKISIRLWFLQASWNYERMQNVGFLFCMIPAIKRLYSKKEDQVKALKRHTAFFNTQPFLTAPILGIVLTQEEKKAEGANVEDKDITATKVGMMGPLAGVGDPIFWATARPVLGALGATFAMSGNILGPIIFFLGWNIIRIAFCWFAQEMAYKQGVKLFNESATGFSLREISQAASVMAMFVLGVLINRWVNINLSLPISTVKNQEWYDVSGSTPFKVVSDLSTGSDNKTPVNWGEVVENASKGKGGLPTVGTTTTTLQDIMNQLLPGLLSLVLLLVVIALLRRKISPIFIIFGLFALGILGAFFGFLS